MTTTLSTMLTEDFRRKLRIHDAKLGRRVKRGFNDILKFEGHYKMTVMAKREARLLEREAKAAPSKQQQGRL